MKTQKNWNKAQIICGKYTKQIFRYSLYISLILYSTIIQSVTLCIFLLYMIIKTNKKLD
ncbi:hypothetical protein NIT62_03905 [Mammaliicoccus sciuri]|nr:hypothetical protein NIT62_03905 [Mammaliicoccus sciuri]